MRRKNHTCRVLDCESGGRDIRSFASSHPHRHAHPIAVLLAAPVAWPENSGCIASRITLEHDGEARHANLTRAIKRRERSFDALLSPEALD